MCLGDFPTCPLDIPKFLQIYLPEGYRYPENIQLVAVGRSQHVQHVQLSAADSAVQSASFRLYRIVRYLSMVATLAVVDKKNSTRGPTPTAGGQSNTQTSMNSFAKWYQLILNII